MKKIINIRMFYSNTKKVQWIQAIGLSLLSSLLIVLILIEVEFPYFVIFIPLLKPIIHFLISPLLNLLGLFKYYSPMFLAIRKNTDEYEIHNGNTFDYFTKMRWKQKGNIAKKQIIIDYLNGLLKIIEEIETNQIPTNIRFIGVSYFFNRNTAQKLGFEIEKAKIIRKFMFFFDIINLSIMYSFAQGRLSMPPYNNLRKINISGKNLLNSKSKILQLLEIINKRKFNGVVY